MAEARNDAYSTAFIRRGNSVCIQQVSLLNAYGIIKS